MGYVTLHVKIVYLTDVRWGDFPGLSMWARCEIRRVLSRGKREGPGQRFENSGGFEDKEGVISHGMQAAPISWGKARKQIVPGAPRRKAALLSALIHPSETHLKLSTSKTVK